MYGYGQPGDREFDSGEAEEESEGEIEEAEEGCGGGCLEGEIKQGGVVVS